MSGFVPLQKSGTFQARMVKADVGDAVKVDPSGPATPVDSVDAPDQGVPEGAVLPQTAEELEVMLDAAREEARVEAGQELEAAQAGLAEQHQQLERLLDQVAASRAEWTSEVRNVLGELVVVGVRQVVSESVELQAALIRDRLGEVGERLLSEQNVILRVRPDDEELARATIGEREGWQILPDGDLSGGVLAETESGKVDATLGAALTGLAESVQAWQDEGIGEE